MKLKFSYECKGDEKLRKNKQNKIIPNNSIRWRWLFMIIDKLVDKLYFKDSKNWWLIVGIEKKLRIKK
jgi:hypothetical protein